MVDLSGQPVSIGRKVWRAVRWPIIVLAVLYVGLVLYRVPAAVERKKTAEAVAKIHATKLALADVMGTNLPPVPDSLLADATIEGVDANGNGIRDDVELAIFAAYPNSARTRAALLQYALALQTQMTLEVVNKETFVATVEVLEGKSLNCIWSLFSRENLEQFVENTTHQENFVKELQYNTQDRESYYKNLVENNLDSFSSSNDDCDIDLSTLPN